MSVTSCQLKPECQAIADKLKEAEEALHELITGQAAYLFIDQNGEQVRYTPAQKSDLQGYINELKNDLAACQGNQSRATGPLYFIY